MSLEQLNEQLADVTEALVGAEKNFSETKGPSKVKAGKMVDNLRAKKAEFEALIAQKLTAQETAAEAKEQPEQDPKAIPTSTAKTASTDVDEIKAGDRVVVKSIGRFTLHDKGIRFPPSMEIETVMTPFIRSQVEVANFLLLAK